MITAPTLHYPGGPPWEEVVFLQLLADDGEGWWLRYALGHGARAEAAVWAVRGRPGDLRGEVGTTPLTAARRGQGWFLGTHHGTLAAGRAVGVVGALSWDLRLEGTAGHDHVPPTLQRLGLGRTYRAEHLVLRAEGEVADERGRRTIRATGVCGHIWGRRNRLAGWVWAHAHLPELGPEAAVEVLSARLGPADRPLWPLTSLVVRHGGRTRAWSGLRHLPRTAARWQADGPWSFAARGRDGHATVHVTPGAPDATALVAYHDEAGRPLWCRNSRFATVDVRVEADDLPAPLVARSEAAAAEIGGRRRPPGEVLAPRGAL